MQLSDSNFPSGAFSHSFGLETLIQNQQVTDAATLEQFMQDYVLQQLTYTDGLAVKLAYEALENDDMDRLWEIDELLFVTCAPTESRLAGSRIGQQMLKICKTLYPSELLLQYEQRIKQKKSYGHSALVQAIIFHSLHIDKQLAIQSTLFTAATSLIQNAVRGVPLGQTAGQQIIKKMYEWLPEALEIIVGLTIRELGCTLPTLEIAQMQHEQLNVRLFMS